MKSEKSNNLALIKPEKVIFVWNYLEWGGAQVYFLGIASRIKDRTAVKFLFPAKTSRQFITFCDNLGIPYEFLEDVSRLKPAPTLKSKLIMHWHKIRSEYRLLKYLKKEDFSNSILHIELAPWQSVAALVWLCLRTKVFITMHNALPPVPKWRFLLWKLKFSIITRFNNFHIFASNQDAKNSLKPLVSKQFLEKVKVTYTNVNPDEVAEALAAEVDRKELCKKFDLPAEKFLVVCLGQFIDRKGRWTFLEAAEKLKALSEDLIFVWISNSNLTAAEQEKIKSYELAGRFFLIKSESVGSSHLELMKFLRIADIFTLPSFVEGLPISLLEAMALGIPSVSTNVYAIPEAVKNLETGMLIEAGNSIELADAIRTLKSDDRLREKLAKNGREFVLENFNEKRVAEVVFENYLNSLNHK